MSSNPFEALGLASAPVRGADPAVLDAIITANRLERTEVAPDLPDLCAICGSYPASTGHPNAGSAGTYFLAGNRNRPNLCGSCWTVARTITDAQLGDEVMPDGATRAAAITALIDAERDNT